MQSVKHSMSDTWKRRIKGWAGGEFNSLQLFVHSNSVTKEKEREKASDKHGYCLW